MSPGFKSTAHLCHDSTFLPKRGTCHHATFPLRRLCFSLRPLFQWPRFLDLRDLFLASFYPPVFFSFLGPLEGTTSFTCDFSLFGTPSPKQPPPCTIFPLTPEPPLTFYAPSFSCSSLNFYRPLADPRNFIFATMCFPFNFFLSPFVQCCLLDDHDVSA